MTGNKSIDNIILILTLLAGLGTAGTFVYTEFLYKRPLPNDSQEFENLKTQTQNNFIPESFKLDKIIVNLPSHTSRLRFLDVEMHLVIFDKSYTKILEDNKALINDLIIEIAADMDPDELNSISGKLIFESRVKNRLNKKLGKMIIKELFYSKFVVQ